MKAKSARAKPWLETLRIEMRAFHPDDFDDFFALDSDPRVMKYFTGGKPAPRAAVEGAMRRVIANSQFTGRPITLDFAKEALKDLLALQERLVTIENIQKTVAEYYKIRVADLLSRRRSRSITRPRQMAMALSKELTNHSLPEIGDAFGGRDHTTVLHACRVMKELRTSQQRLNEDYSNLLRTLAG